MKYKIGFMFCSIFALFALQACENFGVPQIKPDYKESQLGESEIGKFIKDEFNNSKIYKEKLAEKMTHDLRINIQNKLPKNYSAMDLKKKVSYMGMFCNEKNKVCEYQGYIITKGYSFGKIVAGGKSVFTIYLNYEEGLNSLKVVNQVFPLNN